MLDLLVVCVEAGLGLLEAIKVVGNETKAQQLVIGQELSQVAGEVNAGSSLGQALSALADRSGVADIKPLAATLIQSEQLGAAIGPALACDLRLDPFPPPLAMPRSRPRKPPSRFFSRWC